MKISQLGYKAHFETYKENSAFAHLHLARVLSVHKNGYAISGEAGEASAEITGKLMYAAQSAVDFPIVGDWVLADYFDDNSFAIIYDVLPRLTLLKRKSAGQKIDFQPIAANIDVAFIMQAVDGNFNLARLDRYLVMAHEAGIEPVVLLGKTDLVSADALDEKIARISAAHADARIISVSSLNREGINHLLSALDPGKTYCLLGSSGVGKTTLINTLIGRDEFETAAIREKDGRGKHTTTRRELIVLPNGALLIDTPGMRELANFSVETGISETFVEISALTENCRFSDCSHLSEKGCAVLAALADGQVTEPQYQNFIKLQKEARHYGRSYLERRQHDRALGKLYRSIQHSKRKK